MNIKISIKTGLEKPYKIMVNTSGLRHWNLNEKIIKILEEKLNKFPNFS